MSNVSTTPTHDETTLIIQDVASKMFPELVPDYRSALLEVILDELNGRRSEIRFFVNEITAMLKTKGLGSIWSYVIGEAGPRNLNTLCIEFYNEDETKVYVTVQDEDAGETVITFVITVDRINDPAGFTALELLESRTLVA